MLRTRERIEEIKACHRAAFHSEPGYIPLSIRAGLKDASDFLRAARVEASLSWWEARA